MLISRTVKLCRVCGSTSEKEEIGWGVVRGRMEEIWGRERI